MFVNDSWCRDIRTVHKHCSLSDHISLFLYPAYRQRLKQTNPVTKQVKLWTPETESTLQDYFALTDWDVQSMSLGTSALVLTTTSEEVPQPKAVDQQSGMAHAVCSLHCI